MAVQVLHLEPRQGPPSRLASHLRGDTRPETASKPEEGNQPDVVVLVDELTAARRAVARAMAARGTRRRREPKTGLEIVFQGPPESAGRDVVEAWARDCVDWFRKRVPTSRIAVAAIHGDETSSHCHLLASAVGSSGVGLAHVRANLAGAPAGRVGRKEAGRQMSMVQDSLWEEVSRHYGLEQGEVGSRRRHKEIDRSLALDRREENLGETKVELRSLWIVVTQWATRALELLPAAVRDPAKRSLRKIRQRAEHLGLDESERDEKEPRNRAARPAKKPTRAAAPRAR